MTRLSKRNVESIAVPAKGKKDIMLWDADLKGFGVRIKSSGVRTYLIQYRHNGRSRRLTLGKHGAITPDEARKLAKTQLGNVATGEDPAEDRMQRRKAPTFQQLAEDYMERHAIPNKRPNSARDTVPSDGVLYTAK